MRLFVHSLVGPSCGGAIGLLLATSGCTKPTLSEGDEGERGNERDSGAQEAEGDASATPNRPLETVPGDEDDAAAEAIPRMNLLFDADGYDDDTGRSFNTLLITLAVDATVAELNDLLADEDALVVGGYPGQIGDASGLLALRLGTSDAEEMTEAIERLQARDGVEHVAEDALLAPDVVPRPDPTLSGWGWTGTTGGGNWGLKLLNVPALWNWNETIAQREQDPVQVGLIDVGYFEHPDLDYSWSGTGDEHGTHVGGIIGARFGNDEGIDGVNPFVALTPTDGLSGGNVALTVLPALLESTQVINMSMGIPWLRLKADAGISPELPEERDWMNETGALTFEVLKAAQARIGHLPQICVSAGNDAEAARYNSGLANAGIQWGAKNVIVVENLRVDPTHPGGATLSDTFSASLSGTISAPGTQILSTVEAGDYARLSGSSMASPLVAGLVSYLYALEPDLPSPTLEENVVLDLLLASSVPVGGNASNRPDAFHTALDIDRVMGASERLRTLVDIDDGTLDGNRRIDPMTDAEDLDSDHDGNGVLGDGSVDMADFRVWRDARVQDQGNRADLDGRNDHPKLDLNGDEVVLESPTGEVIFMRADFNGDGLLTTSASVPLPGAVGDTATDLDVLGILFEDEFYDAVELPGLADSGDITVDLSDCFSNEDVNEVTIAFLYEEGEAYKVATRFRSEDTNTLVLTVPASTWPVQLRAVDEDGNDVDVIDESFDVTTVGMDIAWEPVCEPEPEGFSLVGVNPSEGHNGEPVRLTLAQLPDEDLLESAVVRFESADGELVREAEIISALMTGTDSGILGAEIDVRVPVIDAAPDWLVFVELADGDEALLPEGNGQAFQHRRRLVGRWNMNRQAADGTCNDPNPSTDWYFWADGTWTDIGTDAQLDRATFGTSTAGIIDGTWSQEGNEVTAQSCANDLGYSFEFQGSYDPEVQTLSGVYTVAEEGSEPFVVSYCSQGYAQPIFGCNDTVCQADRIPFSRDSCIGATCVSEEPLSCLAPNGTRQCLDTAANLDGTVSCDIGDRCAPTIGACCACIDDPDLSDDGAWSCATPAANAPACSGLPVAEGSPCSDDGPQECQFCTFVGEPTVQRCSGGFWLNL